MDIRLLTEIANIRWILPELTQLKNVLGTALSIEIIVSRESADNLDSLPSITQAEKDIPQTHTRECSFNMECAGDKTNRLDAAITQFLAHIGSKSRATVLGCGPGTMGSDIQRITESCDHKDVCCHIDNYCI